MNCSADSSALWQRWLNRAHFNIDLANFEERVELPNHRLVRFSIVVRDFRGGKRLFCIFAHTIEQGAHLFRAVVFIKTGCPTKMFESPLPSWPSGSLNSNGEDGYRRMPAIPLLTLCSVGYDYIGRSGASFTTLQVRQLNNVTKELNMQGLQL